MHKFRSTIVWSLLVATAIAAAGRNCIAAEVAQTDSDRESQCIALLQSEAPPAEKAITCKRLAVFGTARCVPALEPLLNDSSLSSWARIPLEAIADPAAGEALRKTLPKVDGRLLIGVINSIGVRRDGGAVEALAERLTHSDTAVACAAAIALGRVGDAAATAVLQRSLVSTTADVRSAVAQGCILCAERLLNEGKAVEAATLYDVVRQADVPRQRVLEATRGAILARGAEGVPLLAEQLLSADKSSFALGLGTARELTAPAVTDALVAALGRMTPERQALTMLLLADRGDPSALPAILQAAKSGAKSVRLAALSVLTRLGDAACIPALLEFAAESDEEVTGAARAALEGLPGKEVDDELAARLGQAQGNTRRLLIELVGQRRIDAVPALLKAANDADFPTRAAALTALGSVVGSDNLSVLIDRVIAPGNAEEKEVAQSALRAACTRMPDREACADRLTAALARAPVPAKCAVLEILGTMGGTRSLQTVASAAKDANPELQDTASRLLGEWMTVDAAPVLVELATTASDGRYQTRAVRGYIRLVRQFTLPDDQRAEMCRTALQISKRDAEKKLVLEVLERYASVPMLKLAVELAKTPALKEEAAKTSLAIAQKIGGQSVDVRQLITQLGQDPVRVEIVTAEYGAGTTFVDVTETLKKQVHDFPLIVLPSPSYNASFGGDPAPGIVKQLKIQYRMNGALGVASFPENATILLPTPKATTGG